MPHDTDDWNSIEEKLTGIVPVERIQRVNFSRLIAAIWP